MVSMKVNFNRVLVVYPMFGQSMHNTLLTVIYFFGINVFMNCDPADVYCFFILSSLLLTIE